MTISGAQCRAARALAKWPRDHVARLAKVTPEVVAEFEGGLADPGPEVRERLRAALEAGGAVFIDEDAAGGAGVRLKFPSKDVKAIRKLENEGGPVGDDDV